MVSSLATEEATSATASCIDSGMTAIELVAGPVDRIVPSAWTEIIGDPTKTVSPSFAKSFSTFPAKGQGSSTMDFAVSISQIT